jgi:hypothetical protein
VHRTAGDARAARVGPAFGLVAALAVLAGTASFWPTTRSSPVELRALGHPSTPLLGLLIGWSVVGGRGSGGMAPASVLVSPRHAP